MALVRIDIDTSSAISQLDHMNAETAGINDVANILNGIEGGVIPANIDVLNAPVQAVGSLTITGTGTVADETFIINGVTFTAKASGASGAQFNISTTDTTVTAANIATAVTASASARLVGVITCTASGSVVSFTAVTPGLLGNGYVLTESMTDCTLSAIAGGTNGTKSRLKSK